MNKIAFKSIHPFAARMAPEIAFEALKNLKKGATILDPMVGSGTVMRTISELGFNGMGFDIDPLAVLMSRAWTSSCNVNHFLEKADTIIREAKAMDLQDVELPWIDSHVTTRSFISFWFGLKQINALRKLIYTVDTHSTGKYQNLYKIAISRLIITKQRGASLAADISHSRPHRVMEKNDFDVLKEFRKSCFRLAHILEKQELKSSVSIYQGDARNLISVPDSSISSIITSPPYLNAIDYMRGHKLALVWLGYQIDKLGNIRAKSIGAEKAPDEGANIELCKELTKRLTCMQHISARQKNMINRYALDMYCVMKETHRVLEKRSNATFVIGNSCLNNIYIENTKIVRNAAAMFGLELRNQKEREIPQNRRYLPPPSKVEFSALQKRMRTEAIMTFNKT